MLQSLNPSPTIQARSFIRALTRLDQKHQCRDKVIQVCGLSEAQFTEPDSRIPFRKFAEFYEVAARESGDEFFGLNVGAASKLSDFDILGYAALTSATVKDALIMLERYFPALEDGGIVELVEEKYFGHLQYRIFDESVPTRQVTELGVAVMMCWLQSMLGPEWKPHEVRFAHSPHHGTEPHRALFRGIVTFERTRNEILFERSLLEHSIASADPSLNTILRRQLDQILSRFSVTDDWVGRVRKHIIATPPGNQFDAESIAQSLSVSVRTLQRRLALQQTTFRDVVNEAREELAQRYLTERDLSIAQIALMLGYRDISSFYRAFRRWTGTTPDNYRRDQSDNS